jgi:predicted butyrate kinase (DUF1464 family)
LKVTDRKIPTFAEAREELLKAARSDKGYSKTVEIAQEAERKFKESKNAEAVIAAIAIIRPRLPRSGTPVFAQAT